MPITQIDCPSTYTYYPTYPFPKGEGVTPDQANTEAGGQFTSAAGAFAAWLAGLKAAAPKCVGGTDATVCQQTITGPTVVFSVTSGDMGAGVHPQNRYWAQLTATATMSVNCAPQGGTVPPKATWL